MRLESKVALISGGARGIGAAASWTLVALVLYPGQWQRFSLAWLGALVLLVSWGMMRRGHLNRASWLLVGSGLALASSAAVVQGVSHGVTQGRFMLTVICAGLLLGVRQATVVAGASIGCYEPPST